MDQHLPPPAGGMLPLNPSDLPIAIPEQSQTVAAQNESLLRHSTSSDAATATATSTMTSHPAVADRQAPTLTTSHAAHYAPTATPLPIAVGEKVSMSTESQSASELDATSQPATATCAPAQSEPQLPAKPQEGSLPTNSHTITSRPSSIQIPHPPAEFPTLQSTVSLISRPDSPTKQVSSGASSPLSLLSSSPLSERSSFTDDAPEFSTPKRPRLTETFTRHHAHEPQTLIDCDFEREGPEGEGVFRLKPTADQWADFPAILHFAKHHGALNDGCFKIILPEELKDPVPEKPRQVVACNAYRPKRLKNNFWRVTTAPSQGPYSSREAEPNFEESTEAALQRLKKLFCKNIDRRIRDVRYRVDVPAWTPEQRRRAGVPQRSPVHPLKGDELDFSRAIIPGIHTPYVYESAAPFGATFQIHAEDFKLISLNHLYKGRKIWIVIPSTAIDEAEAAFGRKNKCAQFMRHRAEFIFPDKLKQLKVPHRIVDQRPGETVVILPDAYHQGFSTGYTLAEAKNYADAEWKIDEYQPCRAECQLLTAIPELFMRPIAEGEQRLDLCARYDDAGNLIPFIPQAPPPPAAANVEESAGAVATLQPPKRELETDSAVVDESKRIRVE